MSNKHAEWLRRRIRYALNETAWANKDHAAADEIERLTRERDEARALVEHAYLTAWAARHNHCRPQPPDMRKGWRAFAIAHGLTLDPQPAYEGDQ